MPPNDPDDLAPEEDGGSTAGSDVTKGRKALRTAKRELTDEELQSSAVNKLFMDEIDRLEAENAVLSDYRERFHKSDRSNGVLEQRIKVHHAFDIISTGVIAIGGAILGLTKTLVDASVHGSVPVLVGILLIAIGIFAKVVKK